MIYLDNHATTPLDPRVLAAMLPWFQERVGNPSSMQHRAGRAAARAIEAARGEVAALLGAPEDAVLFTSGATESNNLALLGSLAATAGPRRLLVSAVEHASVAAPAEALRAQGVAVKILPVTADGFVDLDALRRELLQRTTVVSIQLANSELGTVQALEEIGAMTRAAGALFHVDATQGLGRVPFAVEPFQVDLASCSAHKIYGPKGVGALYLRRRNPRVRLAPLVHGGGQEKGLRSGTVPTEPIVGFGVAARLALEARDPEHGPLAALRDQLFAVLQAEGAEWNGPDPGARRLANNLHVTVPGVPAAALVADLSEELAMSTGSACASAGQGPSPTLLAVGMSPARAGQSFRLGLGRFTTEEEVARGGRLLAEAIRQQRDRTL